MKKIIKIILLIIISIIALMVILVTVRSIALKKNMIVLNEIVIEDVDLSQKADGVYSGSYKLFPVESEVKVTVANHVITNIVVTKCVGAESIPDKVIEKQSLQIDALTGATFSKKVTIKAIEIALKGEPD